ncbi:hypothetical protein [Turicimonas muris]|uniref:hypothetical protein n=1 Tax=Turicimonas muris TaxID=1796652 RepID=UPI002494FF04|nr:hypothetical protein [Turicimonas muris]
MLVIAGLTLVSRAQTEEAIRRKDAARAENRKTLVYNPWVKAVSATASFPKG